MTEGVAEKQIDLDGRRTPPGWTLAAGLFLAIAGMLHFLMLTPITRNLDDIKYATMWIGGSLSLTVFGLLLMTGRAALPPRSIMIPYLLYLALLPLGTIFAAEDYAKWLGWQQSRTHLTLAGFFFLGTAVTSSVRAARYSIRFWIVAALATCIFGLLHWVGFFEKVYASMLASWQAQRTPDQTPGPLLNLAATFAQSRDMLSTILNRQFFGSFLALILPIAMSGVVVNLESLRDRRRRGQTTGTAVAWILASGVASLLSVVCMYLTFSKSAMLMIPVAVLGFLILVQALTRFNVLKVPAWPVALALLIIAGVTLAVFAWPDFRSQIRSFGRSAESREIIWRGAWDMFKEKPILGNGPGSFRTEFPRFRSPDYHMTDISNVTLSAHNRFLDLLAENGLVGFGIYMWLLGSLFLSLWRAARRCESQYLRVIAIGYATGIFCLYFGNLTIPMMRWPIGQVTTDLALGLAAGVARTALAGNYQLDKSTKGQPWSWTTPRIAGALVTLVGVTTIVNAINESRTYFLSAKANNDGLMLTQAINYGTADGIPRDPQQLAMEVDRFERGEKLFRRSVELNRGYTTAFYKLAHVYNRLGALYARQGRMDLSRDMQEKALATYSDLATTWPDYSEIHYNFAVINMALGTDAYQRAKEAKTDDERARLEKRGQEFMEAAIAAGERACQRSNKISAQNLLAAIHDTYARLLDPERQETLVRREFIAAADQYVHVSELPLTAVPQEVGQIERERYEQRQALITAPELYYAAGAYQKAAEAFERLYNAEASRDLALRRSVSSYARIRDWQAAEEVIRRALARNPVNPATLLLHAEVASERAQLTGDLSEVKERVALYEHLAGTLPGFEDPERRRRLDVVKAFIARTAAAAAAPASPEATETTAEIAEPETAS